MAKKTENGKSGTFFQSEKWKNFLTFLFFLLIASGFWLLQYLQQRFEVNLSIPLKYSNVPSQVALSDDLPQEVRLRVEDKGTILLNYLFSSNKLGSIDVNLKNLRSGQDSFLISSALLENEISRKLLSSTSLISYRPDRIVVSFSPKKEKEVPVVIAGNISIKSGYILEDSIHRNPDKVTLFGSREMLDSIQTIRTELLDLSGLQGDFQKNVSLVFPPGVASTVKSITISGQIEEYTEKNFTIPVTCVNIPEGYVLRFFPSTVELSCPVALSRYVSLTTDSFEVDIDYHDLPGNPGAFVPVRLSKKPSWIGNCRISPESLEFLIEKKDSTP